MVDDTFEITSEELERGDDIKSNNEQKEDRAMSKPRKKMSKKKKAIIITSVVLVVLIIIAVVAFFLPQKKQVEEQEAVKHYSVLSGEEISDESLNTKPTFCIQTPNGGDVADRTHVGLEQAPVVFEAIAEVGITRFAAVYQNPTSGIIGPIRSLRPYYLEWDTPFDCTVVHAGGSDEALADLKTGDYRDLTESTEYMWRDFSMYAAPNNLFTSPKLLNQFNESKKYTQSNISAFGRMKPDEAWQKASGNKSAAEPNNEDNTRDNPDRQPKALVSEVAVNFGSQAAFNVIYTYNPDTNSYARAYASGEKHMTYTCPTDVKDDAKIPKDCGKAKQIAPKAIAVMEVKEGKANDNYHEVITTSSTGNAYIFQNGEMIRGTWTKKSTKDQIEFKDNSGNTIYFTPGQLWISAIPYNTGSVKF